MCLVSTNQNVLEFTEIKSNFLDFFLKAVSHLAEKLAHFYFCCLIELVV